MADLRKFERMLKSVANRKLLAILSHLKKEKEATVGELAEELRLSFKFASKHLAVLYAAELIEREQRSIKMWYRLSESRHEAVALLLQFL